MSSSLGQNIGGIEFKSPLVIGAGPLSDRVDLIKKAAACGVGAVSIKQTAWSQPRPGVRKMYAKRNEFFFNPSDRRLRPEDAEALIHQVKNETDLPLLVNILGDTAELDTWAHLSDRMKAAGADGVELNFACPNPPAQIGKDPGAYKYGASLSQEPELAKQVIETIVKNVAIPVWVKFSGDGTDTATLCKAAKQAGATGVTVFCSPRGAYPIDVNNGGRPKLADLEKCSFGGINGPAIRAASNRVVAEAALAVPEFPVMGGGGISTAEHAIETLMFGASLAFIFTHVMLNGFEVIEKLNDDILAFMEQQGYQSIEEFRGAALSYLVPNSELSYGIGPSAKIDKAKCKGCGSCSKIAFCRAINMQDKLAVVDSDKCECCGLCASICPVDAIHFI